MTSLPRPPLLNKVLHAVARRYRVPAIPAPSVRTQPASPASSIAIAIEDARAAMVRGVAPDAAVKRRFIDALARMIHDAMRAEHGDPAFQAMVLRHRLPQVREYASLSAHADRDRRQVRVTVDAIAHPAKAQQICPGPQRQAVMHLHALASSASWPALADSARQMLLPPQVSDDSPLRRGLKKLLGDPALERLQRLAVLAPDERVRQHQALLDRNSPRAGSPEAAAQGWTTQRRGAAVEALAARALETLARRLAETDGIPGAYRVVTSMRVPASIPGNAERAKTEWDAVLLRQAKPAHAAPAPDAGGSGTAPTGEHFDAAAIWDVCLLVEAKASPDAATTDFPRLLRGLRLLAHAKEDAIYAFATRQGVVRLRGTSLKALTSDADALAGMVLYCCDAPADAAPRLLNAASRMQLLSAPASLSFASRLAENQPTNPVDLEPVWRELLESPRWQAVLHQYATLHRARELMVHVADLSAGIDGTG